MNIGWKCTTNDCGFTVIRDHRAANAIMQHIKREHPDEWEDGRWSMQGIKKEDEQPDDFCCGYSE